MNATYECDRCGACCRTKLVELYEVDVWREPSLHQPMRMYREPGLDGEIGYLNCLTEGGCPFLDGQNSCSIYPSRPSICVMFPAGGEECQQARQSLGLPLLEPTKNDSHNRVVECGSFVSITSVRKEDNTMATTQAKTRPVHEIRLGRIRAAIWENETQNGTRHNVTLSRIYKDGNQWKDSASFGRDDLPLIAKVVDRCHSWIFEQAAVAAASSGGNGNGADGDIPF